DPTPQLPLQREVPLLHNGVAEIGVPAPCRYWKHELELRAVGCGLRRDERIRIAADAGVRVGQSAGHRAEIGGQDVAWPAPADLLQRPRGIEDAIAAANAPLAVSQRIEGEPEARRQAASDVSEALAFRHS